MSLLKKLSLFSIVIIPFENMDNFVDLAYDSLPKNQITLEKVVKIKVNKSASPLFYKFDEPKKLRSIFVEGSLEIKSALKSEKKDTYFQLGVIYQGDYRPNFFVRKILPEWLLKIVDLNESVGISHVNFWHVGEETVNNSDSFGDIELNFKTIHTLNASKKFKFKVQTLDKKIIGLWLRSDGDDHAGVFTATISKLELNP